MQVLTEILEKIENLNYCVRILTYKNHNIEPELKVKIYKGIEINEDNFKKSYFAKEDEKIEDVLMRVLESLVVE